MLMAFKPGVRLNLQHPAIVRMLIGAAIAAEDHAGSYTGELVITAGNDSVHGTASRHYRDEAIDIRSKNFISRDAKRDFRAHLENILNLGLGKLQFRVLLESEDTANEHFHVQVKKGTAFDANLPLAYAIGFRSVGTDGRRVPVYE